MSILNIRNGESDITNFFFKYTHAAKFLNLTIKFLTSKNKEICSKMAETSAVS